MKNMVAVFAIAAALVLLFIAVTILRDLKHKAWMEFTPGEIERLAVGVEAFRAEEGAYPGKLSELQGLPGLLEKGYLGEILAGKSGNRYQYRTVSNGFVITVTRSAGFLSPKEAMEKFFKPGQTFDGEVRTVITTESGATNGLPQKR